MTPPASPRLVLASGSPRRRELLAALGLPFAVRPSAADETPLPGEAPEPLVRRLALAKARAVAAPGELVLGADTVVAVDGEILGKPRDDDEARRMLGRLSDRWHEVWTGVAVVAQGEEDAEAALDAVVSRVRFRALSEAEIAAYVASGEPRDKAGAYAVQGGAARFVAEIAGERDNVVGLPLAATAALLARRGLAPALSRRS